MPNANTYTWVCPACAFEVTSGSPAPPSNCPRCNYPDAKEMIDADLEAEVGPEAALTATTNSVTIHPHPSTTIEPGWLGECIREVITTAGVEVFVADWTGLAEAVVERYNGVRPTMLCGCLSGVHPSGMEALATAHPERVG